MGELIGEVLRCRGVRDEGVSEALRVWRWCREGNRGRCECGEGSRAFRREVCAERGKYVSVASIGRDLPGERLLGCKGVVQASYLV